MGDQRFQAVVDAFPDAVLVLDRRDRVTYANAAALTLLAFDADELVGTDLERLVSRGLGPGFHRRLLEEAGPIRGAVHRKDGVEIEVGFHGYETPDGELVCVLRQLVESVDFLASGDADDLTSYRLLFEHAPIGILHFDADGVITACNPRFVDIIGSSKRVLVGLNMQTLPNDEIRARVAEAIDGRRARYEGDYRSATGGKVTPVRVDFVPIFGEKQNVLGGVGIVEDVTERREAERALVRAERMASLGTLAAGIAHEINTPLTYAMASAELVERQLEHLDPEVRETLAQHIRNVREGADRVRAIVRDVRSFTSPGEERRRAIDLVAVLDNAINLAMPEIRHRAELERDYAGASPVLGTETRLVQLFVNLLANAAQAIEEGHATDNRIRVSARDDEGGRVMVTVEDTGSGIDPADVDRVFEPFFTRKPHGRGSGLGLAICHGIVRSLGGDIRVRSAPGKGSTFTVKLPVSHDGEAESGPPPARRAETGGRLLVIDDEPRLLSTFKLALEPRFEVVTASSGREGLDVLDRDERFDVVLCDLMMPDMGAAEIYAQVSEDRPELASRFVFMTGGAFTERASQFLSSVDNPRLEKPFPLEVLEQLLSERSEAAE